MKSEAFRHLSMHNELLEGRLHRFAAGLVVPVRDVGKSVGEALFGEVGLPGVELPRFRGRLGS